MPILKLLVFTGGMPINKAILERQPGPQPAQCRPLDPRRVTVLKYKFSLRLIASMLHASGLRTQWKMSLLLVA